MAESYRGSSSPRGMPGAVDAAAGMAALTINAAVSVTRLVARAAAPVGRLMLHPPLLNERLHPARVVEAFAERGERARILANADFNRIVAAVVPSVVNEVLDSLDLTELVRRRVDIDSLVSTVDVVAVVDRLDVDAIARQVDIEGMLRQVDLDAIVSKIDIDAIVRQVDIDAIVRQVDIDAIARQMDIEGMLRQVDLDAIVSKIDIDAIVRQVDIDAIARQVDVDAIVSQVDIDAVAKRIDIDAIVERIDIDAIVSRVDVEAILRRLDLVAIAEEVVNGIDLPEIIRESTGSMASDVVRDARMQSIDADVAIARVVDRVIRRRRARRTDAPGEPESLNGAKIRSRADVGQSQPLPLPPAETPKELPP